MNVIKNNQNFSKPTMVTLKEILLHDIQLNRTPVKKYQQQQLSLEHKIKKPSLLILS